MTRREPERGIAPSAPERDLVPSEPERGLAPSELLLRADFAADLAREAGALALAYFRRDIAFATESKGPQDFVSAADRAVEALIRERIARTFPQDTMFGEEAGGAIGTHAWLVDPIDGTINFVHGVRYWCVSIVFLVNGERSIGVIHDPTAGELFRATRGGGAFCNDATIRASSCEQLDEAMLCAGYVSRQSLPAHLALKRALHEAGTAVKDMGAGALMLAHTAAGRYDAYLEPHMHPWDALAGLLLVEEAGGRTLPYPGADGLAGGGAVIASAPCLYDTLLSLMVASGSAPATGEKMR
ncbi:MAG: inositol monophosphatase family protein [Betaproteobacteria bacterium]